MSQNTDTAFLALRLGVVLYLPKHPCGSALAVVSTASCTAGVAIGYCRKTKLVMKCQTSRLAGTSLQKADLNCAERERDQGKVKF